LPRTRQAQREGRSLSDPRMQTNRMTRQPRHGLSDDRQTEPLTLLRAPGGIRHLEVLVEHPPLIRRVYADAVVANDNLQPTLPLAHANKHPTLPPRRGKLQCVPDQLGDDVPTTTLVADRAALPRCRIAYDEANSRASREHRVVPLNPVENRMQIDGADR